MDGEIELRIEGELRKAAVIKISEYLIQCIRNQSWCVARRVGQALEALLEIHPEPTREGGMAAAELNMLEREARRERIR